MKRVRKTGVARKVKVDFIEVTEAPVPAEAKVQAIVKRHYPEAGPVRIYRTTDGRIGVIGDIPVLPGDRARYNAFYRDLSRALGGRRGRPRGEPTVQTKLNLPKKIHKALKGAAKKSGLSMSRLVADYVRANLL